MATKMQLQPKSTALAFRQLDMAIYGTINTPIAKDQLKIGSILHYFGKDAPNTRWSVFKILYEHRRGFASHEKVFTLSDIIVLHLIDKDKFSVKRCSFHYISESSIWRLQ